MSSSEEGWRWLARPGRQRLTCDAGIIYVRIADADDRDAQNESQLPGARIAASPAALRQRCPPVASTGCGADLALVGAWEGAAQGVNDEVGAALRTGHGSSSCWGWPPTTTACLDSWVRGRVAAAMSRQQVDAQPGHTPVRPGWFAATGLCVPSSCGLNRHCLEASSHVC
jgi:hypothetical protein